jgi:hypothetical protein
MPPRASSVRTSADSRSAASGAVTERSRWSSRAGSPASLPGEAIHSSDERPVRSKAVPVAISRTLAPSSKESRSSCANPVRPGLSSRPLRVLGSKKWFRPRSGGVFDSTEPATSQASAVAEPSAPGRYPPAGSSACSRDHSERRAEGSRYFE